MNPLRDAMRQAGRRAQAADSPFRAEAEAALAGFRAARAELERQVRRGELTPTVARRQAAEAAGRLRADLAARSAGYSPAPRAFLDRLAEADRARAQAREGASIEALQRETNRLLRRVLVEQQMVLRAGEFEGRAFVKPMTGGPAAPTLEGLLGVHEAAAAAGDEAAREWARRQLEAMRPRVLDDEGRRRIDRACDRPDAVNPRIVAEYVAALRGREPAALEEFVAQALEARDAGACTAAFLLAREAPEGPALRWVRQVLHGLEQFPDAALATLREAEADARLQEAEAARAQADYAAAVAEAEARFPSLEAPSEAELARLARHQARPVAAPGEPIGLALHRRGVSPEEFAALADPPAE